MKEKVVRCTSPELELVFCVLPSGSEKVRSTLGKIFSRELVSRTYNERQIPVRRKELRKQAKTRTYFSPKRVWCTDLQQVRRCSAPLAVGKTQMKPTMRHRHTPARAAEEEWQRASGAAAFTGAETANHTDVPVQGSG